MPQAYAIASLTGVPAAFLTVTVVLAVFSVGYVAMGQRAVHRVILDLSSALAGDGAV